jgi:hypothetical protein
VSGFVGLLNVSPEGVIREPAGGGYARLKIAEGRDLYRQLSFPGPTSEWMDGLPVTAVGVFLSPDDPVPVRVIDLFGRGRSSMIGVDLALKVSQSSTVEQVPEVRRA